MNKNTENNQNPPEPTNKPAATIESLRKHGFRVRTNVFRYSSKHGKKLIPISCFRMMNYQHLILPKGGKVQVVIYGDDGKAHIGESLCSVNDMFNRREGLKIAIERACRAVTNGEPAK